MTHQVSYLIKIHHPGDGSTFAHTASGKLCEYNSKAAAKAQMTKLVRKANAGRVAKERFEIYPVYY